MKEIAKTMAVTELRLQQMRREKLFMQELIEKKKGGDFLYSHLFDIKVFKFN